MAMEVNEPSYLATPQMSDVTMVIKQGMPGAKKKKTKFGLISFHQFNLGLMRST